MNTTKKEVWNMMDEWKSTNAEKVHSGLDGNNSRMHLACLASMDEVLEVSFV